MAKTNKGASVVSDESESAEMVFEKIKSWTADSQVAIAASFEDPKRSELFECIIRSIQDKAVRGNISLIKKRIDQALISIEGFTLSEIKHYQQLYINKCIDSLHLADLSLRLQDLIRELHFFSKGLEIDLKTKEYEFLEDKEAEISDLIETERFKVYVENLLREYTATPIEKEDTLSERLTAELGSKGFFELDKVKNLSEGNKKKLIVFLSEKQLPYQIAMLNFLGFIDSLKRDYSESIGKTLEIISRILKKNLRAVKGNYYVLNPMSQQRIGGRYTAHEYNTLIRKDYESLK